MMRSTGDAFQPQVETVQEQDQRDPHLQRKARSESVSGKV